ncbi:MAG: ATP-dependent helicase RecG [Clostridia bacterium]|nr:ATP-dependent helicase RecG [Clostridia bacterium]
MTKDLAIPVDTLRYVGSKRAKLLSQLGILTVGDLLYHFPRRYADRRQLKKLDEIIPGAQETVRVCISRWEEKQVRPRLSISRALIKDERGSGYAVWYNQPYIKKKLPPGTTVLLTGSVGRYGFWPELRVEDYEIEGEMDNLNVGRITPFYPSTAGLSQRWFRLIIYLALQEYAAAAPDILPLSLRQRYRLPGIEKALWGMHFPKDEDERRQSRRRFVYEELLLWELGLVLGNRNREKNVGIAHRGGSELVARFLAGLPFKLTAAQERVLGEIFADMESEKPMARLLQGDVGSGKTVVAAAALVKAIAGGWQGALMAPTEILAEQHYLNLRRYLTPLGIKIGLLTSSLNQREREEVLAGLEAGSLPLVVGTHALIQEGVNFRALGLVVIDEQHRFGVRQRASLQQKGDRCDLLVMTATPIPRTLALVAYGDLDISIIDELPPGRQKVITRVLTESQRHKAYALIERELAYGHQAYVICPLIEESEKLEAEAATAVFERLQREVFPSWRVSLLHGRLSAAEKEEVMQKFYRGESHILVATTVVEVGVDVPNATVMLIEDADRYGLAQLHQLRGRIGRGTAQSYCLLLTRSKDGAVRQRLKILEQTSNGFAIAEEDLRLRGPGEFFGERQHGLPEFRIAVLPDDMAALEQARKDARSLVDQGLIYRPEFQALLRVVDNKVKNLQL